MGQSQNIAECKEQLQEDLMCFLDGMEDDVLDRVCKIVIRNFKSLEQKLDNL